MPCSFLAFCGCFVWFFVWFCFGCFACFCVWVGCFVLELALLRSDLCSTFEPPKRDIVNAFANSFNQHNKVRRPGESHRGAGRKKKSKKQYSCKCNGMAGFRGTRLLIEGLYPRLHVANLCQSTMLFGIVWCCCRRLSQRGVGEVLIPLRHCWRDAFFCVCVGSGSFCHDWASHCSVLFWSLDALLFLGSPPLPP